MDFIKVRLQCAVSLRDDICFDPVQNRELVCQQFGVPSLDLLGMTEDGADVSAVCGMLDYIRETQKRNIARFVSIEVADITQSSGSYLYLSALIFSFSQFRSLHHQHLSRCGDKP